LVGFSDFPAGFLRIKFIVANSSEASKDRSAKVLKWGFVWFGEMFFFGTGGIGGLFATVDRTGLGEGPGACAGFLWVTLAFVQATWPSAQEDCQVYF